MSATLLKGKDVAQRLRAQLRARAAAVAQARAQAPRLAVLAVGGSPASQVYLRSKLQACKDAGIEASVEALPEDAAQAELLRVLKDLAEDAGVDGILIEQPLPSRLDSRRILEAVCPEKDVEGVTSCNLGRFYAAKSLRELRANGALTPCTAEALIRLLLETGVPPAGKHAVVVGRSGIVGRPTAHLLSCLDATVTLCHSKTLDLAGHLRRADIVVAALGRRAFIKGEWIKPGAVVLDAGIHGSGKDLCGDVEFAPAAEAASFITPVPGGVGPLTVACLLQNVVLSAERGAGGRLT